MNLPKPRGKVAASNKSSRSVAARGKPELKAAAAGSESRHGAESPLAAVVAGATAGPVPPMAAMAAGPTGLVSPMDGVAAEPTGPVSPMGGVASVALPQESVSASGLAGTKRIATYIHVGTGNEITVVEVAQKGRPSLIKLCEKPKGKGKGKGRVEVTTASTGKLGVPRVWVMMNTVAKEYAEAHITDYVALKQRKNEFLESMKDNDDDEDDGTPDASRVMTEEGASNQAAPLAAVVENTSTDIRSADAPLGAVAGSEAATAEATSADRRSSKSPGAAVGETKASTKKKSKASRAAVPAAVPHTAAAETSEKPLVKTSAATPEGPAGSSQELATCSVCGGVDSLVLESGQAASMCANCTARGSFAKALAALPSDQAAAETADEADEAGGSQSPLFGSQVAETAIVPSDELPESEHTRGADTLIDLNSDVD